VGDCAAIRNDACIAPLLRHPRRNELRRRLRPAVDHKKPPRKRTTLPLRFSWMRLISPFFCSPHNTVRRLNSLDLKAKKEIMLVTRRPCCSTSAHSARRQFGSNRRPCRVRVVPEDGSSSEQGEKVCAPLCRGQVLLSCSGSGTLRKPTAQLMRHTTTTTTTTTITNHKQQHHQQRRPKSSCRIQHRPSSREGVSPANAASSSGPAQPPPSHWAATWGASPARCLPWMAARWRGGCIWMCSSLFAA